MLTRRRFVGCSAFSAAILAAGPKVLSALSAAPVKKPLRLAILGSVYRQGSALQTIADRFMVGFPYEGDWHMPDVQVVSLYVDQRIRRAEAQPNEFMKAMTGELKASWLQPTRGVPEAGGNGREPEEPRNETTQSALEGDLSATRAKQFGFRLCSNIPEALRCGGDKMAVDAILTIVEQDDYPQNDRGQILLPQYDFFQQCAQVFESESHAVPYFNHRQLSFSFSEAQHMVATGARLKFPLLAGSSMPLTWRLPDIDVPLDGSVKEAVMVGVGKLNGTGYDALEAMQSMLERRKGGETGVKAVQVLEGDDVWAAANAGRWSTALLRSALSRSDTPLGVTWLDGRTQDLTMPGVLPQLVKDPKACCIEYADGTRATLLLLNGAIRDFNIALGMVDGSTVSTQFFMTPAPNETHSACLAGKVEEMYASGRAPYPVERTLLTTGLLEACLKSKHQLNMRLETPHLALSYQTPPMSQHMRT